MQNTSTASGQKKSKLRTWVILTGCLLMVIFVTVGLNQRIFRHGSNLGSRLEYIGKNDVGCMPFPFTFICPDADHSDYYFATDMAENDMKTYFAKATYFENQSGSGDTKYLRYRPSGTDKTIYLEFYRTDDTSIARKDLLKKTNKPYVIIMTSGNYDLAKQAL